MLCLAASLFRGWHNGGASADDEDDSKTSKVLFFISGGDAMVQIRIAWKIGGPGLFLPERIIWEISSVSVLPGRKFHANPFSCLSPFARKLSACFLAT